MIVLGDVFAVVATLVSSFLTAFAMIVGLSLLLPSRSQIASEACAASAGKSFMRGLLVGVPTTFVLIVVSSIPIPGAKLTGFLGFCALLMIALIGASGIAWMMADRLRAWEPKLTRPEAFFRSTMFLVGACMLPAVGWFFFAPIILFISLGCGLTACASHRSSTTTS